MELSTPKISHPALTQLVFYGNIHSERLQLEKNQIIQNLETEIDDRTQAKVKAAAGRFVLITGISVKSSEAIGSYVYCAKGSTELYFYSFGGLNEEESVMVLGAHDTYYNGDNKIRYGDVIDRLRQGCAVFLGNMGCHDSLLLKRLASEIGDIKNRWYHTRHSEGMLIISATDSVDSLPEYFTEVFEVISPGAVNKPEVNPKQNTYTFPTPSGSKWGDVKICFVNETTAIISVKDAAERVDFAEVDTGFKNKQNSEFTRPWEVFKFFVEFKGVLSWSSVNQRNVKAAKLDDIYRLKRILRAIFEIPGSPILNYDKAHGYRMLLKINVEPEDFDGIPT